jgi:predicted PurR-regulated permease PerM
MSNNITAGFTGLIFSVTSILNSISSINIQSYVEFFLTFLSVVGWGVLGGVAGIVGKDIAMFAKRSIKKYKKKKKNNKDASIKK